MASTYTGLGTELMTTGENAGTWGTKTNTNLKIIEQISGGYIEKSIAGSAQTTTLSVSDGSVDAELAHRVIKFTGTITGNQVVTIPLDVQQLYVLVNGTSGAYTVQFKYVSGSGSSVTWAATDKGTKLLYAAADHASNPNIVDSGLGSTGAYDLDGNELTLDADSDTSITASTDDQIDIEIAGADDFTFTANAFNVLTGSHATFADSANAKFGTGNDMLVYHDGSNSYITNATGALKLATETSGIALTIGHTTSETTIADNLTTTGNTSVGGTLGVTGVATFATHVALGDSDILKLGAGTDLTLYHDGSNSYITNAVGALKIATETSGIALTIGHTTSETTIADNLTVTGDAQGTTITATTAFVPDASDGAALGTSALEFSDLFLADEAVINFGDDQEVTLTHVADAGLLLNSDNYLTFRDSALKIHSSADGQLDIDADTEVEIAATTVDLNGILDVSGVIVAGGQISASDGTAGAPSISNTGDLNSGLYFSAADTLSFSAGGTAQFTMADGAIAPVTDSDVDLGTASLEFKNVYVDGTTYTDALGFGTVVMELPVADGSDGQVLETDGSGNLDWVSVTGTVTAINNATANELVTIGSTTTELDAEANLTFTGSALTCIGTVTVGVDNTGHDVKYFGATSGNYWLWDESADGVVQIGTLTVGVNDAGHDVKLFGATSGSFALWDESADALLLTDSTPLQIGDAQDLTLYHDGSNSYITNAVGALKIATETSGIAITIGHGTSEVTVADNLTVTGTLTLGSGAELTEAELEFLDGITAGTAAASKAMVADSNVDITGGRNITISGELDAATLDISGNADIDGTTNLDAVDIDGAVQLDATFSVGADDQGYDVKLFGDTASRYWLWDTSADGVVQRGTLTVGVDDTGHDVKFFGASAGAYGLYDESADALEVRGATAAGAGLLKLTTGELTVVDGNKLGRIDFQAPLESDGTDAVAIAASIWAEADATFSASVNNTDIVFATGKSETAAEKFRFTADNEIGIAGANYGTDGQILTSGGAGAACAWEDAAGGGTDWQAVDTSSFTAVAGEGYFCNTTSAAFTATLPAGTIGDEIAFIDYAGTFDTNNLTITANGSEKIHGSTDDLTVSTERAGFTLVYTDGTQGWLLKDK